jgi:hypothetical protein
MALAPVSDVNRERQREFTKETGSRSGARLRSVACLAEVLKRRDGGP